SDSELRPTASGKENARGYTTVVQAARLHHGIKTTSYQRVVRRSRTDSSNKSASFARSGRTLSPSEKTDIRLRTGKLSTTPFSPRGASSSSSAKSASITFARPNFTGD